MDIALHIAMAENLRMALRAIKAATNKIDANYGETSDLHAESQDAEIDIINLLSIMHAHAAFEHPNKPNPYIRLMDYVTRGIADKGIRYKSCSTCRHYLLNVLDDENYCQWLVIDAEPNFYCKDWAEKE